MSRLARQSFLGKSSEEVLKNTTLGVVGLGGGGSHVVQQCAHIGIGGFMVADPDRIDITNTGRLVGGTLKDARRKVWKTKIAARVIRGLQPDARVIEIRDEWETAADQLKHCDLIIGAVDLFRVRDELERFARTHLIPYIDMGMDVHEVRGEEYLVAGQVILSTPDNPCLRCCGVVSDERLAEEAKEYGAAGGRPQVIWPNGVLASTAVGLAIQVISPWFSTCPEFAYLEYDGNEGSVSVSRRVEILRKKGCIHHPNAETGDPLFDIREYRSCEGPWREAWWTTLARGLGRRVRNASGLNGGKGCKRGRRQGAAEGEESTRLRR